MYLFAEHFNSVFELCGLSSYAFTWFDVFTLARQRRRSTARQRRANHQRSSPTSYWRSHVLLWHYVYNISVVEARFMDAFCIMYFPHELDDTVYYVIVEHY